MTHTDRELIEFTKDSVRQILSPKFSKASILSAGCLIAYFLIRIPDVAERLTFLPKHPTAVVAYNFGLLTFSVLCGFSAVRKRFARGRLTGAVCMIASVFLLYRELKELL